MASAIAFDLLYPNHDFAELIILLCDILIPTYIVSNTPKIGLFCLFYQCSPDGNSTTRLLFVW